MKMTRLALGAKCGSPKAPDDSFDRATGAISSAISEVRATEPMPEAECRKNIRRGSFFLLL